MSPAPTDMSLTSMPVTNAALYSVPKLAANGSNWIMYKERILTCMGMRGLMRHLNSTARRPPNPHPWPRPSTSPTTFALASSAKPAAAALSTTTKGEEKSAAAMSKPSGSMVPPSSDPHTSLSDDDYLRKVEEAEAKVDEYEQREFTARQQIYTTISDTMLLKVKNLPAAADVWAALVNEYEGKSEMYANVIRARLLNTKCAEGANVREHLDTLWNLREQLSSMGAALPDQEFSATIFQSLPESYGYLLTALSTASRIAGNPITPLDVIQVINEEYDRRTAQSPSSDSALAVYPSSQPG